MRKIREPVRAVHYLKYNLHCTTGFTLKKYTSKITIG
jgi:hypothetical protein